MATTTRAWLTYFTRPEFDEFVANTLRLERVRKWGQSLIDAGKAYPLAQFGAEPPPDE